MAWRPPRHFMGVEDWQRLNESIYDLCSEVQQMILDNESNEESDDYASFVQVATKLSFFIRELEEDLGI